MLAALWAQGVKVRLHDPQALDEIATTYGDREDLVLCADQYEAAQGASCFMLSDSMETILVLILNSYNK